MGLKRRHLPWLAAMLVGAGFLHAGDFVVPAEGPVAFRRDKIPLDADAMAGLSRQLEILARGLDGKTPEDRRAAAQMLALALALDPANTKARELISEYQNEKHTPFDDLEKLENGRARIWQLIAWLESPEAGSQANALAACLKDVIVISDPKNPKSAAIKQAGEKGAWAGWIPALAAYEAKVIAKSDEPPPVKPGDHAETPPAVTLEKAQVQTVLWQKSGKPDAPSWNLAVAPIQMSAVKQTIPEGGEGAGKPSKQPFAIQIGPQQEGNPLAQTGTFVRNVLAKYHESLPNGMTVTINSPELADSLASGKRQSINAAITVLASSAITGREPDAIIIGQIDNYGAFNLPAGFWDQLLALGKGTGQRLVLPSDAAPYLSCILSLERPAFFLEYEVMLAPDLKQLLALSARNPEGPPAAASAEFRRIRERSGTQEVRQYISNTFVKQRLATVLQDSPTHFSAKALLIQAAGNRPTTFSRPVLASEIRRALLPMAPLTKPDDGSAVSADEAKVGQTFELCRSRIDALERYAEKNDLGLLAQARDVVGTIRNLDKATRTRGESYTVTAAVATARAALVRSATEFAEKLKQETGEAVTPAAGH